MIPVNKTFDQKSCVRISEVVDTVLSRENAELGLTDRIKKIILRNFSAELREKPKEKEFLRTVTCQKMKYLVEATVRGDRPPFALGSFTLKKLSDADIQAIEKEERREAMIQKAIASNGVVDVGHASFYLPEHIMEGLQGRRKLLPENHYIHPDILCKALEKVSKKLKNPKDEMEWYFRDDEGSGVVLNLVINHYPDAENKLAVKSTYYMKPGAVQSRLGMTSLKYEKWLPRRPIITGEGNFAKHLTSFYQKDF